MTHPDPMSPIFECVSGEMRTPIQSGNERTGMMEK